MQPLNTVTPELMDTSMEMLMLLFLLAIVTVFVAIAIREMIGLA